MELGGESFNIDVLSGNIGANSPEEWGGGTAATIRTEQTASAFSPVRKGDGRVGVWWPRRGEEEATALAWNRRGALPPPSSQACLSPDCLLGAGGQECRCWRTEPWQEQQQRSFSLCEHQYNYVSRESHKHELGLLLCQQEQRTVQAQLSQERPLSEGSSNEALLLPLHHQMMRMQLELSQWGSSSHAQKKPHASLAAAHAILPPHKDTYYSPSSVPKAVQSKPFHTKGVSYGQACQSLASNDKQATLQLMQAHKASAHYTTHDDQYLSLYDRESRQVQLTNESSLSNHTPKRSPPTVACGQGGKGGEAPPSSQYQELARKQIRIQAESSQQQGRSPSNGPRPRVLMAGAMSNLISNELPATTCHRGDNHPGNPVNNYHSLSLSPEAKAAHHVPMLIQLQSSCNRNGAANHPLTIQPQQQQCPNRSYDKYLHRELSQSTGKYQTTHTIHVREQATQDSQFQRALELVPKEGAFATDSQEGACRSDSHVVLPYQQHPAEYCVVRQSILDERNRKIEAEKKYTIELDFALKQSAELAVHHQKEEALLMKSEEELVQSVVAKSRAEAEAELQKEEELLRVAVSQSLAKKIQDEKEQEREAELLQHAMTMTLTDEYTNKDKWEQDEEEQVDLAHACFGEEVKMDEDEVVEMERQKSASDVQNLKLESDKVPKLFIEEKGHIISAGGGQIKKTKGYTELEPRNFGGAKSSSKLGNSEWQCEGFAVCRAEDEIL